MTTYEVEYRLLLRRTLITIALCIAAVLICYFWIDRPGGVLCLSPSH
jgi:hypothetical protein